MSDWRTLAQHSTEVFEQLEIVDTREDRQLR